MRRRLLLLAPLPFAILAALACSSNDSTPATDAGTDAGPDTAPVSAPDTGPVTFPDAAQVSCKLGDGSDPVGICVQKAILLAEHKVFDGVNGVPSLWDVTTGAPVTSGGVVLHDVTDDLGYAGMLAEYLVSVQEYGDTEISATVSSDMGVLAGLLQKELAPPPDSYDGLGYLRLRSFAAAIRTLNYLPEAASLDHLADAWGASIYANHYFPQSVAASSPDAGAGDAGGDAGDAAVADAAGTDAAADAGTPDAGGDATTPAPIGAGILGVQGAGGAVTYDTAKAAMGALALIDLSYRAAAGRIVTPGVEAGTPDPASATKYARAAGGVFSYLYARARNGAGQYLSRLVTSSDPGHDSVDPASTEPATQIDADVQGTVALAAMRASAAVTRLSVSALAGFPFEAHGVELIHAVQSNSPSFWDATSTSATSAACAAITPRLDPCGSGFFRSANGATLDKRKTVRSNAFFFAALHRGYLGGALSAEANDLMPLRALFTSRNVANGSFLTVTFNQTAFVPVVTSDFQIQSDGGLPAATSYSAAANADAFDGLGDQWFGLSTAPPSFY